MLVSLLLQLQSERVASQLQITNNNQLQAFQLILLAKFMSMFTRSSACSYVD